MLVKIHETYRKTIAICDDELFGKKLEEGEKQLNLTGKFFDGEPTDLEELEEIVRLGIVEDATFYIVGKESINFFKKHNLITEEGITTIEGIPIALILL